LFELFDINYVLRDSLDGTYNGSTLFSKFFKAHIDCQIMKDHVPFWKRAIAFIFDLLVINFVIAFPFQGIFQQYAGSFNFGIATSFSPHAYYALILISLLALLYFTFSEYYIGQTVGMMLVNIQAISTQGNVGLLKAFIRNCFILPFFPFVLLWLVELIHLIFYKERLLEKITGTKTVMMAKKNIYTEYKLQKV
jgi:uncharacterized RDD family membrane protein YckC